MYVSLIKLTPRNPLTSQLIHEPTTLTSASLFLRHAKLQDELELELGTTCKRVVSR